MKYYADYALDSVTVTCSIPFGADGSWQKSPLYQLGEVLMLRFFHQTITGAAGNISWHGRLRDRRSRRRLSNALGYQKGTYSCHVYPEPLATTAARLNSGARRGFNSSGRDWQARRPNLPPIG